MIMLWNSRELYESNWCMSKSICNLLEGMRNCYCDVHKWQNVVEVELTVVQMQMQNVNILSKWHTFEGYQLSFAVCTNCFENCITVFLNRLHTNSGTWDTMATTCNSFTNSLNQFCWTTSTIPALHSNCSSKTHFFQNTTHKFSAFGTIFMQQTPSHSFTISNQSFSIKYQNRREDAA